LIEEEIMASQKPRIGLIYAGVLVGVGLATVAVILLLQNISMRKHEGQSFYLPIVAVDETTVDPAIWGKNFPFEYDSYSRPADTIRTRWGGSEAFQKLQVFPVWRELFAGYAFGVDYREERGHAFMLSDQRETKRVTAFKQPGACLQCHASAVVAYRRAGIDAGAPGTLLDPFNSPTGRAQLMQGFAQICAMPYTEATKLVTHPVACLDCHDPGTMSLRVTRPGFLAGIARLAESAYPLPQLPSIENWRGGDRKQPYDPNALASRQEMRTLACAQCHVEYYFKGDGKLVTYPWDKGLQAEQIEAYYDEAGFKDWTHKISQAPMLKAQHPEFETWSQGTHARAGVSCADCHMPYTRVGAVKVSNHNVRSPLLDIASSCQTCHRVDQDQLMARAVAIQDKTQAMQEIAEDAVFQLMRDIAAAAAAGATDAQLASPRDFHRKAQWRLDFVAAENSRGFHADQETARVLGAAAEFARRGQIVIARLGLALPADEIRYAPAKPLEEPPAIVPAGH
jgi:nitrite reductase (cytochrome c-552)